MKLYINDNCRFVKGFKNAAIYDFNVNKVYSINNAGRKIIEDVLEGKNISTEDKKYIEELLDLNLLSRKEYILTDEFPNPKLNFAWLEVTEKCNLNCVHCYGQFGQPKINCKNLLTLEQWKHVIDQLIENNCFSIQFIGGEPTISPYLYTLIDYAKNKGMKKMAIFTNATILKEEDIKILKQYGVSVRISVYGHNVKVHDSITGKEGSFELNKKNLLLLKKYNIPSTISVIIMKENEEYLEDIKKYVESINYEFNGYDVIRATDFEHRYEHSIKDYDILKSRYLCKAEFYTSKNDYMINKYMNSCWNSKFAITSTGDILPCVFARDEIIGNVKETLIKELINKQNEYQNITKDMIDVCKDCEFRYSCHDCRPLAKGLYNDIHAKNPRCLYDPYTGEWKNIETVCVEIDKN